jgi:hypothetical protein
MLKTANDSPERGSISCSRKAENVVAGLEKASEQRWHRLNEDQLARRDTDETRLVFDSDFAIRDREGLPSLPLT